MFTGLCSISSNELGMLLMGWEKEIVPTDSVQVRCVDDT